jgi:nucleoside-diphosphate-sugar epimerase
MRKPRLLVVGGTGFIGHHVVRSGVDRGWRVTSLSRNPPVRSRLIEGAEYVAADIRDSQLRSQLPSDCFEYVVNLGGCIDHRLFCQGGRELISSHFGGLQSLVEFLDRDTLLRFIQIGSSDEYGNSPAPQKESMRESPISPYALAKVAGTQFLQMLHLTEAFPAVVFRLFLTYGPGQDQARFLPQVIRGCLADASFPTSAGEQLRDFCFVEDVVSAMFTALHNEEVSGQVFNVASGKEVSVRSAISKVQLLVGRGRPRFGEVAYRQGESMALYADISKARSLLEWEPTTTLDMGILKTVEWMEAEEVGKSRQTRA